MHITIVSRGTVAHTGQVSVQGASGAAIGQVEVRLGDVVEMPDGSCIANLIALEYMGTLAPQCKWLQFVWFEMSAIAIECFLPQLITNGPKLGWFLDR